MSQEPRPIVFAFADAMEQQLRKNDYKGGWETCSDAYLIDKLFEEVVELVDAVSGIDGDNFWVVIKQFGNKVFEKAGQGGSKIKEAADVGNVAMMLADPDRTPEPSKPEATT